MHLLRTGLGVIARRCASPRLDCGDMRASQVTGPSSSCVPCPKTPPSPSSASHPLTQISVLPSCSCTHSALGMTSISWLTSRPARLRTYAWQVALLPPSQGSLPTGAGLPLAGRLRTRWTTHQRFLGVLADPRSPSTSIAWSHARPDPGFGRGMGCTVRSSTVMYTTLTSMDRGRYGARPRGFAIEQSTGCGRRGRKPDRPL
jgi:hypothetical protein